MEKTRNFQTHLHKCYTLLITTMLILSRAFGNNPDGLALRSGRWAPRSIMTIFVQSVAPHLRNQYARSEFESASGSSAGITVCGPRSLSQAHCAGHHHFMSWWNQTRPLAVNYLPGAASWRVLKRWPVQSAPRLGGSLFLYCISKCDTRYAQNAHPTSEHYCKTAPCLEPSFPQPAFGQLTNLNK